MNGSVGDGTDPDPWAGDSIPASTGLGDLGWGGDTAAERSDDTTNDTVDRRRGSHDSGRRARTAIAVMAVVALVGAALARSANTSDGAAGRSATTVSELPPVSLPSTTAAGPPSTVDPATIVDEPPREILDDDVILESDRPDRFVGQTFVDQVDLPPAVASITEESEVVGLTSDGRLLTLAIPSGVVQTVGLTDPLDQLGGGDVVAAPTFTAVVLGGTDLSVVGADGSVTTIDPDEFDIDGVRPTGFTLARQGWVRAADGTDLVVVLAYDDRLIADRTFTVDRDGLVQPLDDGIDPVVGFPLRANGTRILNDAGGSYAIDETGTVRRVSDGFTIATTGSLTLQRTCDENLSCRYVVVDLLTGESTPADFDETVLRFGDVSLSPDGRAVAFDRQDRGFVRVITDLDTGTSVDGVQPYTQGTGWAADSSGEFVLAEGDGLSFVPRTTGADVEQIQFDIGPRFALTNLDVRQNEMIERPDEAIDDGPAEP